MIKNIKSIITSGKQLMLLSLILVSGGSVVHAQEATGVPDTVYVSFTNSGALPSMVYGTAFEDYMAVSTFNETSLKYMWALAGNTGSHQLMENYQNKFKSGKSFKDIMKFSATPTVKDGVKLQLVETALQDALDCYQSVTELYGSPVVYKLSKEATATLERTIPVTRAELTITPRDTVRFYGDPNPVYSLADFTIEGLAAGDDAATIFAGENELAVTFGGDVNTAAGQEVYVTLAAGTVDNYSWEQKQAKMAIKKALLSLALPDSSRLYDDKNIAKIKGEELLVTSGTLKNDQTLSDLFFSDELNVIHTAVSAGLGKVKSDVGTYSYQLATQADTAKVYWRLANYDVQAIAPANYVVEKDTITVTVFPSDAQVEIEGKKVSVMQKVYGEKNPDGYFWLTKRKESAGSSSPSYTFTTAAPVAKDYISAENEADKGFTVAPVVSYLDYEGNAVTEKTDVNLKREKPNQIEDSLYVAKVGNADKISSKNYAFKVVDGTLKINQRPLDFQKVVVDRIYGETKQDTTWTFEANNAEKQRGLASFDAAYQISTNKKAFELIDVMPQLVIKKQAADSTLCAGSYIDTLQIKLVTVDNTVTPKFKAMDRNYSLKYSLLTDNAKTNDSIRLEVAKADLKIKLGTIQRTFGAAVPDFNDVEIQKEFITYTGFKLDESAKNLDLVATVAEGNRIKNLEIADQPSVLPVGIYELTGIRDINKENTNYAITIEGKALYQVIPDNSLVLEWNPLTVDLIVGDKIKLDAKVKKDQNIIAEGAQIDFVSSDPAKIQIEKVGDYCYLFAKALTDNDGVTITASYHGLAGYEEVTKTVAYKVIRLKNEADYNIVLGDMSFVYDGKAKEADVKITDLEGLKEYPHYVLYNGDTDLPVKAGIYNVSIYLEEGKGNSNLFIRKETMQIKAGEVTVTPKDVSLVYGTAVPESFEYTVNGFIGNDSFKAGKEPKVKVAGEITGVGEYTLYVEGGDPGDNYVLVTKTGILTVTKSGLTIKADTIRSVYGEEIPEFTFTVTDPDGKKVDPETLNDIYTIKTEVEPEDAGEYDLLIDCVGVGEGDYDVVMIPAKLYIEKADAGLIWDIDGTTMAGGDSILLTAEAVSPATITYTMQYDTVASVKAVEEGAWITGKHQGVTKLYISIPEEKNYLAANDSVTFNVTSTVANESIALQNVGLYPTFVENETSVTSDSPVVMIRVFDASGRLVKSIEKPESLINLSELSKGYHLVQIVLESGEAKTVRIMKK